MAGENKAKSFVKSVELHVEKNNTNHHTNEISTEQLIVRRGQEFRLTVEFCQPFKPQIQPLLLTAKTGEYPVAERGTLSNFAVPESAIKQPPGAKAVWKAAEFSKTGTNKVTLSITPPADCPVGRFTLSVKNTNKGKDKETDKGKDKKTEKDKKEPKKEKEADKEKEKKADKEKEKKADKEKEKKADKEKEKKADKEKEKKADKEKEAEKDEDEEILVGSLVVLFNAWCSDDWVYLADEAERQEYVLNEYGSIYRGSAHRIHSKCWDYGQFEPLMMDICLKLLDVNPKHDKDPADDVSARCNPIYVGRVISRMINSVGDRGVLEGCWGGPYEPHTRPTHWNGSYAILKKWFEKDCHPVRYGQCWVFAGVMCSVMRAFGIPCRPVTNFDSAHDTDGNLLIEVLHYENGERQGSDSVWNFHVWTEGYMRRPDLSEDGKYDGWQALDPTPQEPSGGVYCCGPAPVCAIFSGDLHHKYDLPFVFAEVNADCIDYQIADDGSMSVIESNTKRVGKNVSTKAVGTKERHDITNTYKHEEGSEKERAIFKYALEKVAPPKEEEEEEKMEVEEEETPEPKPIEEQLSIQIDNVCDPVNGQEVSLMLVISCDKKDPMPLSINITIAARNYSGESRGTIQNEVREETLQPGEDLSIPIKVPFSVYRKLMHECDSMRVSVVVKHGEKKFLAEEVFELEDPPMSLTVAGELTVKKPAAASMVFVNPINETLTNCSLTLSGSGLIPGDWEWKVPDIAAGHQLGIKIKFYPEKAGKSKTLTAEFTCEPFGDIKATCSCKVNPAASSML